MDIIPKNGESSGRPNGGMEAGITNGGEKGYTKNPA